MGSVFNMNEKCHHCDMYAVMDTYYYKTGEGSTFCSCCGKETSAYFKRDDNGHVVMKSVYLPLDGSIVYGLAAKSNESIVVAKETPVGKSDTSEMMRIFINGSPIGDKEKKKDEYKEMFPDFYLEQENLNNNCNLGKYHYTNIFLKKPDGSYRQLYYIGNDLEIVEHTGDKFLEFKEADWDLVDKGGFGIIEQKNSEGNERYVQLLSEMNEDSDFSIYENDGFTNKTIILFQPETKNLICVLGELPDEWKNAV